MAGTPAPAHGDVRAGARGALGTPRRRVVAAGAGRRGGARRWMRRVPRLPVTRRIAHAQAASPCARARAPTPSGALGAARLLGRRCCLSARHVGEPWEWRSSSPRPRHAVGCSGRSSVRLRPCLGPRRVCPRPRRGLAGTVTVHRLDPPRDRASLAATSVDSPVAITCRGAGLVSKGVDRWRSLSAWMVSVP